MSSSSFDKRYFLLPRSEIGFLRFILEGYDGLAFVRTLDKRNGLVEIAFPGGRCADVSDVLRALSVEMPLQEVPAPHPVPPL